MLEEVLCFLYLEVSKMSTQKILLNFAEFKKLKEIEKRYHELQTQLSGLFETTQI